MQAVITGVATESGDPKDFSWVGIKLLPKTKEEERMLTTIVANHRRLTEEESSEPIAEIASVFSSDPIELELEISFPKPTCPVAT